MDGPKDYYAKWNKSVRKTNTIWPHLYVDTDNSVVMARGKGECQLGGWQSGENGDFCNSAKNKNKEK